MKVGNHYQKPLPLKNPDVKLPNSRKVAERRLLYLKKRFMKDDRFYQQYTELRQEILKKGYAKESKSNQDGRVWYLSHHGVYHPRKPGKIRFVFDCSSELNGRSINKELLMGSDLTNQLIEVLTRFQQEEVAVMADIEKMYFQILVSDEHRSC